MGFKKLFLKLEPFLFYVNIFFAVLLLSSYLSGVISPQRFWPLAFLGLIYPILLILNVFFCVYWTIRLKKCFFISAISIVTGFNVLLNSVEFSFSANRLSISSTSHLKLMTYNVHNFQNIDSVNLPSYKPILKLINLKQPDIVGFEEFYNRSSYLKICDSLGKILHTDQYYFEPFIKTPYDSTGIALFSKYPIIHRGCVKLSSEGKDNQAIYIDIKYKLTTVRIYCFHLKSLQFDPEDYTYLDDFLHKGIINFFGMKRITVKLKQGFIIRGQQVDMIRQHASKCPYPYIFMGDFNDTPSSYAFNQLAAGMKNAFREKGIGIGKTFNGGFASLQIDYILASQQFHIFDYQIIHKKISDHYPLYSEVGLN